MLRRVLGRLGLGRAPEAEPTRTVPAPTYTEAELLARAEEFNRNADGYWRDIAADPAARAQALNKPFATIPDAASSLYRLGLVIAELRLGVGHTVLDFGAGSCWLSSALNRLGCRTVSVDVSPAALELGRALFALDPRHRPELEPRFLPYDGHRLPVHDASMDRIACFDAFHHVPNQDELLAEMYRVLRPGGRAVLAEPGEGHSHADMSQAETERYGVLENDLDISDLAVRARKAGFDRVLLKPYPDPGAMILDVADYLRLMEGEESLYPMQVLRDHLRNFYIIALTKGQEAYDSRNPHLLRAEIEVPEERRTLRGRGGSPVAFPVVLRNAGDTTWLHERTVAGGFVVLAGNLLDAGGTEVRREYLRRVLLPRDVAPGEQVEVTVATELPPEVGRYVLRLDLVDDKVIWFGQVGSAVADVAMQVDALAEDVDAGALRARLELEDDRSSGRALRAAPGTRIALRVRVANEGTVAWVAADRPTPGAVSLGGHLLDAAGGVALRDALRASLGHAVPPGGSILVEAALQAPLAAGEYRLKLDMVMDHVCWFEQRGSAPLVLPLVVPDVIPDSTDPGVLRALVEQAGGTRGLRGAAGGEAEVRVRALNTGNTRWLAVSPAGRGHVSLGVQLLDAAGAVLELDHVRVPLPRDVAPGESVDLAARVPVPPTPGAYVVRLDMVDEGIAWFGPQGSATLELDLVADAPESLK